MIEVLLPSLNEQATIAIMTKVIDAGLQRYYPNIPSRIVNIDSNSTDATVAAFTDTHTLTPKLSLKCPDGLVGKGYGIYEGLRQAQIDDASHVLMLDADLRSATPEWIKMLLDPVVRGEAGLSAPVYTRNRYEGNGTNHFSSPLIYACFGMNFLQPIAGDFAFSRGLTDHVVLNMQNLSDFQYGVDSVITTTALVEEFGVAQTFLGKKIHNPSFPKIKRIFMGEATSALYILNQSRSRVIDKGGKIPEGMQELDQRIIDEEFVVKPNDERIASLRDDAEALIKPTDIKDILGTGKPLESKSGLKVDQETWVDALGTSLANVLGKDMSYDQVSDQAEALLPLYLLRVVSYFEEIEGLEFQQIDAMLFNQKRAIRQSLMYHLQ